MPTIKDIARVAGVSQGTVSNVLNNRGNVSVEKINLVKKAAQELGYQINEKARLLREGVSRSIAVILPDLKIPCYAQFYSALHEYLSGKGYSLQLYQTQDIPAIEKSILKNIEASIGSGIISITCLSDASVHYNTLLMKDTKKIFALRHPKTECNYTSFDYHQAGIDIQNYIKSNNYRHVALFSGPKNYSCEAEFVDSLCCSLPPISFDFSHIEAEYVEINKKAFEIVQLPQRPDCIIATNEPYRDALKTAYHYAGIQNIPEIIVLTHATLHRCCGDTEYQLDYQKLGLELGKQILAENNTSTHTERILTNTGFRLERTPDLKTQVPLSLNFLTINSPTTQALKKILPLFERETGIKIHLLSFPYDETYNTIQAFGTSGTYDILRLDMAWGSWFASEHLTPFDEISNYDKQIFDNILPELHHDYCTFNGKKCAFPLDPSIQLLFYRKDLFEDVILKRSYYEQYKKELKAPQTFEELNQIARYFTQKYNPSSPTPYGMTMVAGNTGMASCEVIPRLLAFQSATPTNPAFTLTEQVGTMALQNYLECSSYCKKIQNCWWNEAIEEFASGEAAMTIVFANHASEIIGSQSTKVAGKLGYAPIPGEKPLLGGGILGISKSSAKKELAMKFLQWIARDDISLIITLLGGTSGNPIVYNNPEIIQRYPWMPEAKNNFSMGVGRKNWLNSQKVVEERKVEEILGISIRNVLIGNLPPEQALDYAQNAINKLL